MYSVVVHVADNLRFVSFLLIALLRPGGAVDEPGALLLLGQPDGAWMHALRGHFKQL